jgi:uncharacterized membrane protein YedE/YeeE
MKKLILFLMLVLSGSVTSQIAPPRQKIVLNLPQTYTPTLKVGAGMMIGGAAIFVAGVLTPPLMVGGSTTQKQPFYKQGGRALAMVSGGIVFTIGVGKSLADY